MKVPVKKSISGIILGILLLTSTPTLAISMGSSNVFIQPAFAETSDTISGFIVDEILQVPIPNATVSIPMLSVQTQSDPFGFYRFDNVTSGTYSLFTTSPGYTDKTISNINTTSSPTKPWIRQDVEMTSVGPTPISTGIQGTVYDRNTGLPLIGANVDISGPTPSSPQTDEFGQYKVEKLLPATYSVNASSAGYSSFMQQVVVTNGTHLSLDESVADFYLKADPSTVQGQVLGYMGSPSLEGLPNVTVEAILNFGSGVELEEEVYKIAVTDESGDYTLDDLPPGMYSIKAVPGAYDTQTFDVEFTPGDARVENHNFTFSEKAEIKVTVKSTIYADSMTLSGITVNLRTLDGIFSFSRNMIMSKTTDGDGVATFSNLPTAQYEISVHDVKKGHAVFYSKTVHLNTVFADDPTESFQEELDLIPKTYSIFGTVSQKGNLTERGIETIKTSPRFLFEIVKDTDDSDGATLVETLEPASPEFAFYPHCFDGNGVNVDKFQIPLSLACWESHAYELDDLEGATIEIKSAIFNSMPIDSSKIPANVTSDAEGKYRFDDLLPGTYILEVTKPNLFKKELTVDLADLFVRNEDVKIGLERNITLQSTIVDIFGLTYGVLFFDQKNEKRVPLNNATITLSNGVESFPATSEENGFYFIQDVPLDIDPSLLASGNVSLADVNATTYDVTISADGYQDIVRPGAIIPNEDNGIIYTKNLMTIQNPGKLTVIETWEAKSSESEFTDSGVGLSNLSLTTLYDTLTGFSSANKFANNTFGFVGGSAMNAFSVHPFREQGTMGEIECVGELNCNSGKWEIFFLPGDSGRYELEIVGRSQVCNAGDGGYCRTSAQNSIDVPLYRIVLDGNNPVVNLHIRCIPSEQPCIFSFSGTQATEIRHIQLGLKENPDPIDQSIDLNLQGYVYDITTGKPITNADIRIDMGSPGKLGSEYKSFLGAPALSTLYGQVPASGSTTPFSMFDTITESDNGRFSMEGTFDGLPKITHKDIFDNFFMSFAGNIHWHMVMSITNAPGYDDIVGSLSDFDNATINNENMVDLSIYNIPSLLPRLPHCDVFDGFGEPRVWGCSRDFTDPLRLFMSPHGLIDTIVWSNPTEGFEIDNPSKMPGVNDTLALDVEVTIEEISDLTFISTSVNNTNQVNVEPLANGTYTLTAEADKHYPLTATPITITGMNPHHDLIFRLEPIPDPTVIEDSFFIYYPSGAGGQPLEELDQKRKLKGFIIKGFTSPFTNNTMAQVQIDRGMLREGFVDPVVKVELEVSPKDGTICERDIDKEPEELTVAFSGRLVEDVAIRDKFGNSTGEISDANKQSLWIFDQVDPESDLPCGEPEFRFNIFTAKPFFYQTLPVNYDIHPSYAKPLLNIALILGAWGDDIKPSFLKDTGTTILFKIPDVAEFEIGDLQINLQGNKNFLDYNVTKFALKVDFDKVKLVKSSIGKLLGKINLSVPSIFIEMDKVILFGDNGLFNGDGKAGFEINQNGTKKETESFGDSFAKQFKLKKQNDGKILLGLKKVPGLVATPSYKSGLVASYGILHKKVQGVENPAFEPPATVDPSDGITEEFDIKQSTTVGLTIPLLSKVLTAAFPPLGPVGVFLEAIGLGVDFEITGTTSPGIKATIPLSVYNPPATPWRVLNLNKSLTFAPSFDLGPTGTLKFAGDLVSASLGGKLTLESKFSTTPSTPDVPTKDGPFTLTEVLIRGVQETTLKVNTKYVSEEKKWMLGPYVFWERSWKSDSIGHQTKLTDRIDYADSGFVSIVEDNPADWSLFPPTIGDPEQFGNLREKVHPGPTLDIDTNDNGNAMIGFIQQDTNRSLPDNLQVEEMILDQSDLTWSDSNEIHTSREMPDMGGAAVRYYENDKVMAVWSTMERSVTEPFELVRYFNEADVQYATFNAGTNLWSAPVNLTEDDFLDTPPIIAEDGTGKVMAVWIKDRDGYLLTLDDNDLFYSIWNGASWSQPAVALSGAHARTISVTYENGKAAIAYNHSPTIGDNSEVSVMVFESNVWGAPQQVSDGTSAFNPGVEIKNGNGVVVWAQIGDTDVFTTLFYSEFTSPPTPKQPITTTQRILDLSTTTFGDDIVIVWSTEQANSTSLHYSQFNGAQWDSFTALEQNGAKFPILSAAADDSTERLHVVYYNQTEGSYDLSFYRTTLNATSPYVAPVEPTPLNAPTVIMSEPFNGEAFSLDSNIDFSGFADDLTDGDLTSSLAWTSDLDGAIGAGGDFITTLTNGTHIINATVSDLDGDVGFALATITVGIEDIVLDNDSDGFDSSVDCNDNDDTIFPGAPETPYDTIDSDCDGLDPNDVDLDGSPSDQAVGGTPDCDDTDDTIFPGAPELIDGKDNDCDGMIDEADDSDGDGVSDDVDNCPNDSNPGQEDSDGDTIGDACDDTFNITTNTTLSSNFVVPGNLLVENNSLLTINSGVTVTIPPGSNLTVESGSGVLIKDGGTLQVNS